MVSLFFFQNKFARSSHEAIPRARSCIVCVKQKLQREAEQRYSHARETHILIVRKRRKGDVLHNIYNATGGAKKVQAGAWIPCAFKKSALDFLEIDGVALGQPHPPLRTNCKIHAASDLQHPQLQGIAADKMKSRLRDKGLSFRSTRALVKTEKKTAASLSNGDKASLCRLHKIFAVRLPIVVSRVPPDLSQACPKLVWLGRAALGRTSKRSALAKSALNNCTSFPDNNWGEKTRFVILAVLKKSMAF